MANIKIEAPLVNGSLMPYISHDDSCKEVVTFICGDDLRPPPRHVAITLRTSTGKEAILTIPNADDGTARITVDGVTI